MGSPHTPGRHHCHIRCSIQRLMLQGIEGVRRLVSSAINQICLIKYTLADVSHILHPNSPASNGAPELVAGGGEGRALMVSAGGVTTVLVTGVGLGARGQ